MGRRQHCQVGPQQALEGVMPLAQTIECLGRQLRDGISGRLYVLAFRGVEAGEFYFGCHPILLPRGDVRHGRVQFLR